MSIRRLAGQCAVLLVASYAIPVFADPVAFQARATIGQQRYELTFEDVINPDDVGSFDFRDGFSIADTLLIKGAGLTTTYGSFFFDLSGQWSDTGHSEGVQFMGRATGQGLAPGNGHAHQELNSFDREEYNGTLGWAITSNFSAYAGYKRATVDLTQATTPVLSPLPNFGDVLFVGDYAMEFEYDGYFLGATYSIPVRTWGALSLQSSIARLDGSFSQVFSGAAVIFTGTLTPFFLDPSFRNGVVEGRSTGINVGISWTGNFGALGSGFDRLSYTIGVDHSEYSFDSGESNAFWAADFTEKTTRGRLDLRYLFTVGE